MRSPASSETAPTTPSATRTSSNDAPVFRIPEEQERYEYGSPEHEALGDISARISEGLEERQAFRDEAANRASQLLDQWSKMQEEYYRAFNEVYGVG